METWFPAFFLFRYGSNILSAVSLIIQEREMTLQMNSTTNWLLRQ